MSRTLGTGEAKCVPNTTTWWGRGSGWSGPTLASQAPAQHHATPCPTEAGAISGKGRARPGNSKMDQRGPWVAEDTCQLVSQAGGATRGVGLVEACCATGLPSGVGLW